MRNTTGYTVLKSDGQPIVNASYADLQHASNDLPLLRTIHKTSLYIRDNARGTLVNPLPRQES